MSDTPQQAWLHDFDKRQRDAIANARAYAANPFGDIGHNQKPIIAKQAELLDGYEKILIELSGAAPYMREVIESMETCRYPRTLSEGDGKFMASMLRLTAEKLEEPAAFLKAKREQPHES